VQGVVLDDDQEVAGLFKNGHELKDREGPADLQVLEPAVQPAEDGGIVSADAEDFVTLQVQVVIQRLGEHLIWGYQGVEGPGPEGDGGGGVPSPYNRLDARRIKGRSGRRAKVMRLLISFLYAKLSFKIDF